MTLNLNGGASMTRLANHLLTSTGRYLGIVPTHPRQMAHLAKDGLLPRNDAMPSAFRRKPV